MQKKPIPCSSLSFSISGKYKELYWELLGFPLHFLLQVVFTAQYFGTRHGWSAPKGPMVEYSVHTKRRSSSCDVVFFFGKFLMGLFFNPI